jgi:hypothetical protein
MAKKTVKATLVKLDETGVGLARLTRVDQQGDKFVYFRPRNLPDYRGETLSELARGGLRPGRKLDIDLDMDSAGEVHEVSSVRLTKP